MIRETLEFFCLIVLKSLNLKNFSILDTKSSIKSGNTAFREKEKSSKKFFVKLYLNLYIEKTLVYWTREVRLKAKVQLFRIKKKVQKIFLSNCT